MKTMTKIVSIPCFALAFSAAADIVVDDWKFPALDGSETVGEKKIYSGPFAYGIEKTGDGTLTLPLDNLATRNPLKLDIRSGKMKITDAGTYPTVTDAPAVLDSALFWVAADKNLASDGNNVSVWYDARETQSGDTWGNAYPAAVATQPSWASAMTYPELKQVDGRNMVWFGGSVTAGVTMRFHSAADRTVAETISGIREVFVVTRFTSVLGNVIGSKSGLDQYFQSGSTISMTGNYIERSAKLTVPSGINSLNGELFDPRTTTVRPGTQLLNYHHISRNEITADYFFNDREMENRAGGEYLCEAVFFAKELSLEERAEVECYLMDKWGIEYVRPRTDIKIAKGAEAEISDLPGGFTASGNGTLTFRNAPAGKRFTVDGFNGGVNVAEGSLMLGRAALDSTAESGVAMNAVKTLDGGDYLVTAAEPKAGEVSVTVVESVDPSRPEGMIRFTGIPESVTNVSARAQVVSLAAPRELADAAADGTATDVRDAVFIDPGFESQTSNLTFSDERTVCGWTFGGFVNSNAAFYHTAGWWCDYPPPEGKVAMGVKTNNGTAPSAHASTKVTVPVKGAYELSFKTCGRVTTSILQTAVSLEKDGVSHHLGNATSYVLLGYSERRFRTPVLDPGEYTLVLKFSSLGDAFGMFDDFKMTLAHDQDRTDVFPVPYGTFGAVSYTANYKQMNHIHTYNTVNGWTFTLGGRGALNSGCPGAGVTSIGMNESFVYNSCSSRYGDSQLTLWDTDSVATSGTFTALPPGKWRLRCRLSRWGLSDYWPGRHPLLTAAVAPVFAASVIVNGTEVELGTAEAENFIFSRHTFPGTVTVEEGDSVSVAIKQTVADAAGQLDDLEFVKADDETVISDDFENVGQWTFSANDTAETTGNATLLNYTTPSYGSVGASGIYGLLLVDLGSAEHELTFPEGGVYRLSFWARARFYENSVYPTRFRHGGNRVRASLVDDDGVKTEILTTHSLYETNFVEFTALFKIPESAEGPITRTLRLEGLNDAVSVKTCKLGWNNDLNAIIDDLTVTKCPSADIDINPDTTLHLAEGTVLNLDFDGEKKVREVRIGTRRLNGEINAARFPALVSGIGSLYAEPPGFTVILR